MSSGERRGSALDADPVTAELTAADAEAAAAEAEARAEAARARAQRLRQGAADGEDTKPTGSKRHRLPRGRPRWLRPPRLKTVAAGLLVVVVCAACGVSGSLIWQHHVVSVYKHRIAAAATAARDGIEALMALDPADAEQSVQRVIDHSTGNFRENYQRESETMTKGLQETQVSTTVTINDVAVDSVTDDEAVVLLAVRTVRTDADGVQAPPWPWRVQVTLAREGGQYKMSEVDYIG